MLARAIMAYCRREGAWFTVRGLSGDVPNRHPLLSVNWRDACAEMRVGDFSTVTALTTPKRDLDHAIWCAIIDDLGAGEELERSYLRNAVDRVADARLGQWTIWTSNLPLEQISRDLDRRVTSRMHRGGNMVIEVPPETQDFARRTME